MGSLVGTKDDLDKGVADEESAVRAAFDRKAARSRHS